MTKLHNYATIRNLIFIGSKIVLNIIQFNNIEVSFIRNIINLIKERGYGYHQIPFFEKTNSAITIKVFLKGHKYIGHYNIFANNAQNKENIIIEKHKFSINEVERIEHEGIIENLIKDIIIKT